MGDLSELIASIAEKGSSSRWSSGSAASRFQIIAGERRYQAAVQAGLRELPVVIRDVDDTEVIELALIENLQRKDLTPFEEAEALRSLRDTLRLHPRGSGEAAREVADVDHRVAGARRRCPRRSEIFVGWPTFHSKSLLLQIVRQADSEKMIALIERRPARPAGDQSVTREPLRAEQEEGRVGPRPSCSSTRPPTKAFSLKLNFRKSDVPQDEVISALEDHHQRTSAPTPSALHRYRTAR